MSDEGDNTDDPQVAEADDPIEQTGEMHYVDSTGKKRDRALWAELLDESMDDIDDDDPDPDDPNEDDGA